ncbi:MAG: GldG family protein [Clostridiales bacterium]|jgi:ABC-type uncharacterized transport system involved in gliding motility auxiliary subunit|nr:GldG family protein [Clostridiales bacterium]
MNKILDSLISKRVRYGAFSTLMIVIVIVILVIVNLVAGRLDLSFDMTANKKFSISDETKEALAKIGQDVSIYVLVRTGEENNIFSSAVGPLTFKELLREYTNANSHISVEYKDPYLYPQFAEKYSEDGSALSVNTVIVESGGRFRAINPNDMITTDYDMNTYQQYVKTIDIEPRVTNAINYVTAENTSVVYTFTSNNETDIPDGLKNQIAMANYDVKTFDIFTEDIPEDCTILFITQPARDWIEDTADKVKTYIQNDGRALFVVNNVFVPMPNLNSVLEAYGVKIGEYLVVEGSADHFVLNNPRYLLPNIVSHDLTQTLIDRNYRPLLIQCSGVDFAELKKNSTKIEPLLTSTSVAYGKTNPETTTLAKEDGDADGPFNLAVAITDSFSTDTQHTSKLVVAAASSIVDESVNSTIGGANYLFLINSLNWLQDKDDTVYIPSKQPSANQQLTMTQQQVYLLMAVSIFVIPPAIIAIGLVVWLRRRYS